MARPWPLLDAEVAFGDKSLERTDDVSRLNRLLVAPMVTPDDLKRVRLLQFLDDLKDLTL